MTTGGSRRTVKIEDFESRFNVMATFLWNIYTRPIAPDDYALNLYPQIIQIYLHFLKS